MADLYSAAFNMLCGNVFTFSLSPDTKLIAFIEYPEEGKQFDTLYTVDISGQNKNMLLGLSDFSGIQWSPTGDYIAYSGGKDSERDIGIIRKDGTDNELLTHGMSSTGEPHWSKDSSRIAFTSSKSSPFVYIITLNMAMEAPSYKGKSIPSQKREMVSWLKNLLAKETENILSSGEDT
jgi:Tol biopolymer transport system component